MVKDDEEKHLASVALQDVQSLVAARQRVEQELVRTKEALGEETRTLELLSETGAKLASTLDLHGVMQAVTDAAAHLCGAQFGAFFCTMSRTLSPARAGEGDAFSLVTRSGTHVAPARDEPASGPPIAAPLFRGDGVVRIADASVDPRFAALGSRHGVAPEHLPVKSYLAAPVVARSGRVMGGFVLGHAERDVFTPRSERLIAGIAAQAAIAVDNARLCADATRSAEERARLLDAERSARASVEHVSLMKDEFLATLSHELRTPLNAMLGWSRILLSRPAQDVETRRGLETIARNARAQAQLIDDLLDMSQIVSGKVRVEAQRLELAPVVDAAIEAVTPSAEAKAIVLRRDIDRGAGRVLGDPSRLQQVLWNLLINAVKFTPTGGTIDVVLRRAGASAELVVADSGVGIEGDFLPCLFERFRQADSSITRRFGGLGLGLSIVKQLVELHGGTVEAASGGAGKGATFTVRLPLHERDERGAAPRATPTSAPPPGPVPSRVSLAGIKVLVVDDEADARDLLGTVLTDAHATVLLAASAAEAFALLQSEVPDVIVSDIGMPGRDGYQLIRDVRGLDPSRGGRTPAVALTAFARSEDRTRAVLAGYQLHVPKPVEPEELVVTVRSLVANAVPVSERRTGGGGERRRERASGSRYPRRP